MRKLKRGDWIYVNNGEYKIIGIENITTNINHHKTRIICINKTGNSYTYIMYNNEHPVNQRIYKI